MDPDSKIALGVGSVIVLLLCVLIFSLYAKQKRTDELRSTRPGYCETCGRWDGQPVLTEKK
jgi:hypothetical protein